MNLKSKTAFYICLKMTRVILLKVIIYKTEFRLSKITAKDENSFFTFLVRYIYCNEENETDI